MKFKINDSYFEEKNKQVNSLLQTAILMAGNKTKLGKLINTRTQTIIAWERGQTVTDKNLKKLNDFVGKK